MHHKLLYRLMACLLAVPMILGTVSTAYAVEEPGEEISEEAEPSEGETTEEESEGDETEGESSEEAEIAEDSEDSGEETTQDEELTDSEPLDSEPADSKEPADSEDPADPSEPSDPAEPSDPTDPETPEDPNEPQPSKTWTFTQKRVFLSRGALFDILEGENGELIIVDGGYVHSVAKDTSSAEVDSIKVMQEVLEKHGNHVDAWIVTHMHLDHCEVFSSMYDRGLLKNVTIDQMVLSEQPSTAEMKAWYGDTYLSKLSQSDYQYFVDAWDRFNATVEKCQKAAADTTFVQEGDSLDLLGIQCQILNAYSKENLDAAMPDVKSGDYAGGPENDTSLIIRMTFPSGDTLLLTGDAEYRVFDRIRAKNPSALKADYVQAAHHGICNPANLHRGQIIDQYVKLFGVKGIFIPHISTSSWQRQLADTLKQYGIKAYPADRDRSIVFGEGSADNFEPPITYKVSKWIWTDDYSAATVTLTATGNGSITMDVKGEVTSKTDANATTYTAKANYLGITYTDTKTLALNGPATAVKLNKTTLELSAGQTSQLTATLTPAASKDTITWKSSDPSIATVSDKGVVTMQPKYGSCTITATTGSGKTATCKVQMRFKDVKDSGKYYYKPVYWAAERGITKGYMTAADKGTKNYGAFGYDLACTRAHVVTFLWRMAGSPTPKSTKMPFPDVKKSAYYYKAVLWAAENVITKGYSDGTFKPDATCLREHVVTFLYRYAGSPSIGSSGNPFNDIKKSDYYYKAVLWAATNKITNGYSSGPYKGGFGPKLDCLREHVVTFLYRYERNMQ